MSHIDLASLEWREFEGEMVPGVIKKAVWCVSPWAHPGIIVGIDPGKKFGIAASISGMLAMGYGELKSDTMYDAGVEAYKLMSSEDTRLDGALGGALLYCANRIVIEGPAFGAPYGQPGLMAIRCGFAYAPMHYGVAPAQMVPPMTIRKAVTGHGRVELLDIITLPFEKTKRWEEAADALGACLYGLTAVVGSSILE